MVPLWAYFCMFQVTEFLLWVWISLYGQMSCQNCEWNTNFWRNNGCLLLSSKEKIMMKKLAIENPKLIWLLQNNFCRGKKSLIFNGLEVRKTYHFDDVINVYLIFYLTKMATFKVAAFSDNLSASSEYIASKKNV